MQEQWAGSTLHSLVSVWQLQINDRVKNKAQLLLLAVVSPLLWRQEFVDVGVPEPVHGLQEKTTASATSPVLLD